VSYRLNIQWNMTSSLPPAELGAYIGHASGLVSLQGESVEASRPPLALTGRTLKERAAKSRERNWEALQRLADL
jgi:hypothetical protein